MRPVRLTLQGFRSHQERTEIAFSNRTLLAIVGPVGSGKSSILEAIAYALYGRAPSVGANTSKLISSRCESAEVVFEFTAEDRTYIVERSIRRGNRPAVHALVDDVGNKENGETAVNHKIVEVLGLDYAAFCSSVLLPQGRFADFLKASRTDRTKVLKGVFRFDQIDAMKEAAKSRRADLDLTLAELKGAGEEIGEDVADRLKETKAALKEVRRRAGALDKALPKEMALLSEIDAGDEQGAQLTDDVEELIEARDALPPLASVEALAESEKDLNERVAAAEKALAGAKRTRSKLSERLATQQAELGKASDLDRLLGKAEMRVEEAKRALDLESGIEKLGASLDEARAAAEKRAAAERKAMDLMRALAAERAELTKAHSAHALRQHLRPGEPCPVCEQQVAKVPKASGEGPAALETLKAREEAAEVEASAARAAVAAATAEVTRIETESKSARGTAGELTARLAGLDEALSAVVGRTKDPVAAITRRLEKLRDSKEATEAAARATEDATEALNALKDERSAMGARKEQIAHDLSHLASVLKAARPKPGDAADALAARARELLGACADSIAGLRARIDAIGSRKAKAESALAALRESLEVLPEDTIEGAWKHVQVEAGTYEANVKLLNEQVEKAKELAAKTRSARAERAIYSTLEDDLRDTNFVNYLLEEKRLLLSSLASVKLEELTGRYRFDDEGEFKIVDEFDGDKVRTVDTLSGGESFLASLALSLGLADAVARHGGRLRCFFLDEGFGSLDTDSLEHALDGIERIVTPDRLIALVSHVPWMADRIEDKLVLDKAEDGTTIVVTGAEGPGPPT